MWACVALAVACSAGRLVAPALAVSVFREPGGTSLVSAVRPFVNAGAARSGAGASVRRILAFQGRVLVVCDGCLRWLFAMPGGLTRVGIREGCRGRALAPRTGRSHRVDAQGDDRIGVAVR